MQRRMLVVGVVVALLSAGLPTIGALTDEAHGTGAGLPLAAAGEVTNCGDRTPRTPIRIVDDAMFKLGPVVGVRNPASNGTAEDPYRISGWCIRPAPGDPVQPAVLIQDTSAHVVLSDNRVDGTGLKGTGIELRNARNVEIVGNRIKDTDDGVLLRGSSHITITDNGISGNSDLLDRDADGVVLLDSKRVTIAGNKVKFNDARGIFLDSSHRVSIVGNTVKGNWDGIVLDPGSSDTTIARNTVSNRFDGIDVLGSDRVEIVNNTVVDNGDGVSIDASDRSTIANNTIRGQGLDDIVRVVDSADARISYNAIVDNDGAAIDIFRSDGTIVNGNDIRENAGGLTVERGSRPIDARRNYWNASSGPSGGVEDACTGTIADGAGQAITTRDGGEVCFDPWRSAPNPDAGAD